MSNENAALHLQHGFLNIFDMNKYATGVLVDLSKALDSLDRNILFDK